MTSISSFYMQYFLLLQMVRCNVHCLHCGSDCSSSEVIPDMPAEDFLRVIDKSITPYVVPHKVLII